MDMSKIFLKDACPTPVGGQAILEGVMMRGMERTAIAVRIPDGRIHIKTRKNGNASKWMKVPIVRGVFSFITSLVEGTKTLTYSADVLEYYDRKLKDDKADGESEKMGKIESLLSEKLGSQKLWSLMLAASVIFALVFSVGIFVLLPTAAVGWIKAYVSSPILLNLTEGILRIVMFLLYLSAISKMEDIKRVFQYHGAEHKTIHCFENNLELTPENAQTFYTLHPRCGTSFLMFVMIISLILFSLLGWPNLLWRLVSRIILIPVVAGTSYELLKWAGRSDNIVVRILSLPGLYLQKITTNEPDEKQLEVAIASLKAVMVDPEAPCIEGIIDEDMNLTEEIKISEAK
ncbi:PF07136 family protein [Eubacterium nodatum ATCC 33099]|nr:PF07136 family protein [Eubacterium nodatum ATCC 33099]